MPSVHVHRRSIATRMTAKDMRAGAPSLHPHIYMRAGAPSLHLHIYMRAGAPSLHLHIYMRASAPPLHLHIYMRAGAPSLHLSLSTPPASRASGSVITGYGQARERMWVVGREHLWEGCSHGLWAGEDEPVTGQRERAHREHFPYGQGRMSPLRRMLPCSR